MKGKQGTEIHICNSSTYEIEAGGSGVWDQWGCVLKLCIKQNKINNYNDDGDGVDNNNLEGLIHHWATANKLSFQDDTCVHFNLNKRLLESKKEYNFVD